MNFILDWQMEELNILLAVKEAERKIENENRKKEVVENERCK